MANLHHLPIIFCLFSFINNGNQVEMKCDSSITRFEFRKNSLLNLDGSSVAPKVLNEFRAWRKEGQAVLESLGKQNDTFNCGVSG